MVIILIPACTITVITNNFINYSVFLLHIKLKINCYFKIEMSSIKYFSITFETN